MSDDNIEKGVDQVDIPEASEAPQDGPETFPRSYVEKLRGEAAEARVKAKRADELAHQLFYARVAATGRLADPNDLPFDDKLLDDHAAMDAAIEQLIGDRPHYAARIPRGDIGQGAVASTEGVDLAALLKKGA